MLTFSPEFRSQANPSAVRAERPPGRGCSFVFRAVTQGRGDLAFAKIPRQAAASHRRPLLCSLSKRRAMRSFVAESALTLALLGFCHGLLGRLFERAVTLPQVLRRLLDVVAAGSLLGEVA